MGAEMSVFLNESNAVWYVYVHLNCTSCTKRPGSGLTILLKFLIKPSIEIAVSYKCTYIFHHLGYWYFENRLDFRLINFHPFR